MTSPANIAWTPDQLRGIRTTGVNLLVSAAAGSGKTAVLAERCAYLVCDARPTCDVDQLLVVTYTEAAAAEMRSRIERALRQRMQSRPSPRLERQLALIDRAQVSTLHSFCARLLRQNFHLLGLDPAFGVLDGDEQELLRREVAREMLAARYETDADGAFARLIDHYADGDDEALIPRLLKAHDLLCSLVDPDEWLERSRQRIDSAMAPGRLEDCDLGRELVQLLHDELGSIVRQCEEGARQTQLADGPEPYVQYLETLGELGATWLRALARHGIDGLASSIETTDFPRRPSIKHDVPGRETAGALIETLQEAMKKGTVPQLAQFTASQWREGLERIAPSNTLFLDLVDEFARRYDHAKDTARRVDFSDLERLALRILRDPAQKTLAPSNVARLCHRQFQHVLVDEYQDANQVQDAILYLVSHECVAAEGQTPNLFCVGDVKQSIYGFRLAEPGRFLERYRRYKATEEDAAKVELSLFDVPKPTLFAHTIKPPFNRDPKETAPQPAPAEPEPASKTKRSARARDAGIVIDLQANFRSRKPLLDSINAVFRRLMTADAAQIDYTAAHELRAGAAYPAGGDHTFRGAPIELHLLPDRIDSPDPDDSGDSSAPSLPPEIEELERSEREATFVVNRIRLLTGLDGGRPMNVTSRAPGQWVTRPIRYRDMVILLRSMRVRADQYADILRQAGIPVHREGGGGFFDSMEVRDMRSLLRLLDNRQQDIPLAAVLRSPLAALAQPEDCLARIRLAYNSARIPFHQAAARYTREQTDELAAGLRDIFDRIARWRDLARHRPLAQLIWGIYDETGYLAFCAGLADGAQRVANLIELHERAAQFGQFARQGLYRFLAFLDSLEAETDYGQPSVLPESADVVRIMSVHHSKGLEFPVVFVPELGKKFNLQDCAGPILMGRDAGLGLSVADDSRRIRYPSLASVLVRHSIRKQSLAEEMRILYVAMTRAQEHLILSGTCNANRAEAWNTVWRSHERPMPAPDVLRAAGTLEWIGPVSAMTENEGVFDRKMYSAQEIAQWSAQGLRRPAFTELQQALARLEPLKPAPPADERARAVINRVVTAYPLDELARVEAVRSVTQWTKHGREAVVSYELPRGTDPADRTLVFDSLLVQPRCLSSTDQLSAAQKGTATHTVLQRLSLRESCDRSNINQQIARLVDRRLLTTSEAKAVDVEAVEWFLRTSLGQLVRTAGPRLRREMEFHFAVDPAEVQAEPGSEPVAGDSADRVMIRGRIDAMITESRGLIVIDYKTDRVAGPQMEARAEFYRPQVQLYSRALRAITGQTVRRVALVFLHARQIIETAEPAPQ